MEYLWSHWPPVLDKKFSGKMVLFLDFDGTLAPIAKKPESVRVRPEVRRALCRLARSPSRKVVLISGRSLKDLKRRLPVRGAIYAGNHGFEIRGPGLRAPFGRAAAAKAAATMERAAKELEEALGGLPGVRVENKGWTLSVHFRDLPAGRKRRFDAIVRSLVRRTAGRPGLSWRHGKKVWELGPDGGWGKGAAAAHILKKLGQGLEVVVGDDETDESMFRVFRGRGVTVRVGRSRSSAAEYYLRTSAEVACLLNRLLPEKAGRR